MKCKVLKNILSYTNTPCFCPPFTPTAHLCHKRRQVNSLSQTDRIAQGDSIDEWKVVCFQTIDLCNDCAKECVSNKS